MSDAEASSSPSLPVEEQVEGLSSNLLDRTREEIARADQKASILLAASGVAIGAVLAGAIGGKWSPFYLANSVEWVWWLGAFACVGGLISIGRAVYPQTRRAGSFDGIAFFGDVVATGQRDLHAALKRTIEQRLNPVEDQLYQNSKIVVKKYESIQWGLKLLLAGGAISVLAIFLNLLVGTPGA